MIRTFTVFVILLSFKLLKPLRAEVFSSIAGMQSLLQTEGMVIRNLEEYLEAQKDRLKIFER